MIDIDWSPDWRKLRSFGLLCGAFVMLWGLHLAWRPGAFSQSFGWNEQWRWPIVSWSLGILVALIGVAAPHALRPIYVGWMGVAFPISWVVSHLLLGLTYFGVFTPFAMVFRIIGRDELHRSLDHDTTTYWRDRGSAPELSRYFKQF